MSLVCGNGVKLDSGKHRPSLVLHSFARALGEVIAVAEFGARKYTPDGWVLVENGVARYTDAMLRHQLALAQGQEEDPESGLPHRAHIAWNALAVLELTLRANAAGESQPKTTPTKDIVDADSK